MICVLEGRGNTPNTSTMESIFFSRARLALIFLPLFIGPRVTSGNWTFTPELVRGQDLGVDYRSPSVKAFAAILYQW